MNEPSTQAPDDGVWDRLRRRKVVQWSVAYVAAAWALLQGLEFLADLYGWPTALLRVVTLALALGLPIASTLAWYHGDRGARRVSGTELTIVALLLILAGGGIWYYQRTSATEGVAPSPASTKAIATDASIAVLPFVNMSSDPEQEYFSDGLSEELLNTLVRLPGLRVIGRTSSFQFKGKNEDLRVIGEKLGAAHLLEGSVRKAGKQVRITAQLIRANDGSHLWSQTYDRTLEDIFAVQEDIATRVVSELQISLVGSNPLSTPAREQDLEAYNLLLQGRHLVRSTDYEGAIQLFKRSVDVNPASARAWTDLATAHLGQADDFGVPSKVGYARAREAIDRALALDPNSGAAFSALSWIQGYDLEWKPALASLRTALSLEPGNSTVLFQSGWTLAQLGYREEALQLIEKSIALDPLEHRGYDIHWIVLASLGRFAEAEVSCRTAYGLWPDFFASTLSWILLRQGKTDAALQVLEQGDDDAYRQLALSYAYHTLGKKKESDSALALTVASVPTSMKAYHIAELHAWRGEDDLAFEWLDRSFATGESHVGDIQLSTDFQRLHADPRYLAFLRKMKFRE